MTISISVNRETCKKDGLCVKVCPGRLFFREDDDTPAETRNTDECALCGQCVAVCPSNSITHSGLDRARFEKIEKRDWVTAEALHQFMAQRRSVRVYKKEPPPRELVEKVVRIAGFAPGSPHHQVGWVRNVTIVHGYDNMKIVRDITFDYMKRIRKLLEGWMIRVVSRFDASAKAGRAALPDFIMRIEEYEAGRDAIVYGAPAALFLHAPRHSTEPNADCDAAMMSILLMAKAHGIGTCWNGLISKAASGDHLRGFTPLREFLKLPPENNVYAACIMGYPGVKLHSIPHRETAITWIGE